MGIKIDIKPTDLKTLLGLLQKYLPNTLVWAFGSRVKFTANTNSDLDLVAFITEKQKMSFSLLKEAFAESNLTFKVDLHNWNDLPDNFKRNIEASYVVLLECEKSDLPSGWKKYKLGEICKNIAYGYTESASSDVVGPKFLRITDIQNDFISWDRVPYCPITKENHKKYKLEIGDIIIARTGASTGATAIFKDGEIDAVFASYLIRYKIDKEIAYPFYIGQLLKSALWRSYVASIIGGSAQPGANAKQFADFEFPLPDLPTQTQISQILSSLDDKIELNLQMNQTLENMAQALFKEWFINFNFPGFDGQLVDGLPKGWKMGKLGEICLNIKNSYNPKQKELNSHYVGLEHIPRKSLTLLDWGHSTDISSQKSQFLNGDVLFGKLRPYFHKVVIAPFDGICSTDILVLRAIKKNLQYYTFFHLFSDDCIQYANSHSAGTRMPRVNWDSLSKYGILIPPDDILSLFQHALNPIIEKINSSIYENQTLTQTRDTLLPKLMNGKLELKK